MPLFGPLRDSIRHSGFPGKLSLIQRSVYFATLSLAQLTGHVELAFANCLTRRILRDLQPYVGCSHGKKPHKDPSADKHFQV